MPTLAHREYLDVLPSEWEQVRLGDLGDVYAGSTPRRSEPKYWEGHIPWLTPSEVTGRTDKWVNKTDEYITDAGYQSTSVHLVPEGSLLVTTRATIGEVVIAGVPITTNQGFKNLVLGPDDDPLFYYYVLRFIADEMKRLASGSTFDEINKSDFTDIVVPRPNPSEQRRIADVLDTVDAAIQETDAVVEKQERVKTGLLQDLLTRGLDVDGRLRDPEREPEAFRETELGNLPKEWKVEHVGEISDVVRGSSPRPKGDPRYYGGPIGRLMGEDVTRDGKWVTPQIDSLTHEGAERSRPMKRGSLVLICSGNVGLPGLLAVDACIHDGFLGLKNIEEADVEFLYMWFLFVQQKMDAAATHGGVFTNLTTKILKETKIAIPPLKEQKQIVNTYEALRRQENTEQRYMRKLRSLKNGLMQDLLTGRVRVPEAEDRVDEVTA
jgi:type I restriction enzyme S subunit